MDNYVDNVEKSVFKQQNECIVGKNSADSPIKIPQRKSPWNAVGISWYLSGTTCSAFKIMAGIAFSRLYVRGVETPKKASCRENVCLG